MAKQWPKGTIGEIIPKTVPVKVEGGIPSGRTWSLLRQPPAIVTVIDDGGSSGRLRESARGRVV
jgi:2-phospho-L-lactate transferase/gluconeogenesis factor (CofD/UPF0052 family)